MKPTWRPLPLPLAGLIAMAGLMAADPQAARAQIPVYSTERVFAPTGPVMTGRTYAVTPAPVVTTGPTYIVHGRPIYRTERRFFALRPNYVGRPQLSFAPYSDAYPKSAPLQPTYYPTYPR
jgi:hypothetical protein